MENVSKAVLMAGGMLLAIVVITLFIIGYTNVTHLAQVEVDEELREEIDRFNKQYLAFNKNVMYGTDVISILNLTISNNKINNVANKPSDELYVNVSFKLKETIQDTVYEYTLNEDTAIYSSQLLTKKTSEYGAGNYSFETNHNYSITSNLDAITEFLKTVNKEEEKKTIIRTKGATVLKYTITYSGIANFKRRTFKCSNVEYDSYGRVKSLHFEQIIK